MTTVATIGDRALRRLGVVIVAAADRPALGAPIAPAQIAQAALIELGVIAPDDVVLAADLALAQAKVDQVTSSLIAQGIIKKTASANIPAEMAEEYTRLTALYLASAFGKSADPAMLTLMEQRVRHLALIANAHALAESAVQQTHDDLVATGLARWTVFDIPVAAEGPYEILAANDLAQLFDKQADPRADVQAMRQLAQITALPSSGERVRTEYF